MTSVFTTKQLLMAEAMLGIIRVFPQEDTPMDGEERVLCTYMTVFGHMVTGLQEIPLSICKELFQLDRIVGEDPTSAYTTACLKLAEYGWKDEVIAHLRANAMAVRDARIKILKKKTPHSRRKQIAKSVLCGLVVGSTITAGAYAVVSLLRK